MKHHTVETSARFYTFRQLLPKTVAQKYDLLGFRSRHLFEVDIKYVFLNKNAD